MVNFTKRLVLWLMVIFSFGLTQQTMESKEKKKSRVLRHVVCFKFKDSAKESEVEKVVKAFADLKNKISSIKAFEMGTNNSPEGLDKGFTHCFVVTFDNEEGRKEYLPHPEHKKFVGLLKPILEDVFVIDYWSQ
jgi:hypothetical protein